MKTCADPTELLRQARAGSDSARGQLLEAYTPYLTLLARLQIGRKLQGKADAADLVQETFLAAHARFAKFRGTSEAEFMYWLRQILATRLATLLRHYLGTKRRDIRLERGLAMDLDKSSQLLDGGLLAQVSSPSQRLARREQAVLLADALANLPDDYHEVIVLRHLEELPFADVAIRMGRSIDSVQKLWLRALSRLRRSMGDLE